MPATAHQKYLAAIGYGGGGGALGTFAVSSTNVTPHGKPAIVWQSGTSASTYTSAKLVRGN